jgi:hypothetical protein
VFYAYLFSVKIDRDKSGIEQFLHKIKIVHLKILRTKVDRGESLRTYGITEGYEAKGFALMQIIQVVLFMVVAMVLVNLKF